MDAECQAKSVSVVEDNEDFYTAQLIAHEIGHRYSHMIYINVPYIFRLTKYANIYVSLRALSHITRELSLILWF